MEEAKVRLPSILIKDIRRLAVDGDDPTDQEASECSNTVKYHDVCRSLQKPARHCGSARGSPAPSWCWPSRLALSLSGRLAPPMASARNSQLGFSRIYDYLQERKYYYCILTINDLYLYSSPQIDSFHPLDRITTTRKERCRRDITRTPRRHRIFPLNLPVPLFPYSLSESSSSDEPKITDLSRVSRNKLEALIYDRSPSTSGLIWLKAEILRIHASVFKLGNFQFAVGGPSQSSSTSKS